MLNPRSVVAGRPPSILNGGENALGLTTLPAQRAQAPPRPAFYDWSQSMTVAWSTWLASYATAAQLARLVELRLTELLALARRHSPFYRHLYRGLPAVCPLEALPVVNKSMLMAGFDRVAIDRAVNRATVDRFLRDGHAVGHAFLGRYAVWTSSGTSGEAGIYVHDGHALAVYEALEALRSRNLDSPALLPLAILPGDRSAFVGATGGHFAGTASFERLRWLNPWIRSRARSFSILDPLPELVRALNDYQPTMLGTYPSAACLLAQEQGAGRLAIRPREIWTGGEGLSAVQRERIASTFGCRVHNEYGASEFLAMASECRHGTLHLNADWLILEAVDEHYRPVPPGVPSHTVLVTNLANRVQPIIRYDLGDSVTLLGRCRCGSALPAIHVEGRCDDVLSLADAHGRLVKLLPLALTTVLEDDADTYRFQLAQTGADQLRLRLDMPAAAEAEARCRHALGRYLGAQGLGNVRLVVEHGPLTRDPASGKVQRVIVRRHACTPVH